MAKELATTASLAAAVLFGVLAAFRMGLALGAPWGGQLGAEGSRTCTRIACAPQVGHPRSFSLLLASPCSPKQA